MAEECFVCGATTGKMSRDHVPPQNLFLKPLPTNLITLKSCQKTCNEDFKKDDEYFRVFAAGSAYSSSSTAKAIWKDRIVKAKKIGNMASFERSPGLKKRIREALEYKQIRTRSGLYLGIAPTVTFEPMRISRVLSKIFKGLFIRHFPFVGAKNFDVQMVRKDSEEFKLMLNRLDRTNRKVIKEGTFWYNWITDPEDNSYTVWEIWIYDALVFHAFISKKEGIT